MLGLIKINPPEILKIFNTDLISYLNIPEAKIQAHSVKDGWTVENYKILQIQLFETPIGKEKISESSYNINEDKTLIIESYEIRDIPSPIIETPIQIIEIPTQISDRQFFHILALMKIITKEEALSAVKTGEIPAAMKSLIDQLEEDKKFDAEMLLSGATIFERNHQLVNNFGTMFGWTKEQIDQMFIDANKL
jgi:hypothetical protein